MSTLGSLFQGSFPGPHFCYVSSENNFFPLGHLIQFIFTHLLVGFSDSCVSYFLDYEFNDDRTVFSHSCLIQHLEPEHLEPVFNKQLELEGPEGTHIPQSDALLLASLSQSYLQLDFRSCVLKQITEFFCTQPHQSQT